MFRGTVESLDGNALTVKTREGPSVKIALADNYTVVAVVPLELSAIAARALRTWVSILRV